MGSVLRCVFVTPLAVGDLSPFSAVPDGMVVDCLSYCAEVGWIDAGAHAAKVVDVGAIGDGAYVNFIGNPMG
jgi:hypothetical protein